MQVIAVVVVYNQRVEECVACVSIRESVSPWDRVVVMDNSAPQYLSPNEETCVRWGWQHRAMGGNMGLAKAYNAAICEWGKEDSFFVFFDSDTQIPPDYLEVLHQRAIEESDVGVWVPWVIDDKGLLSPCRMGVCLAKRFQNVGEVHRAAKKSAINSGMVVRGDWALRLPYNEKMFLDYIDHEFLGRFFSSGGRMGLLERVTLRQNFADTSPQNPDAQFHRFVLFSKDFRVYCQGNSFRRLLGEAYLLFRRVKLAFRHRDSRFLKIIH